MTLTRLAIRSGGTEHEKVVPRRSRPCLVIWHVTNGPPVPSRIDGWEANRVFSVV